MFVNHFHVFFFVEGPNTNMKIELFGHPLNPRALGIPLCPRAPNSVQDSLNGSSVRPNGTPVMPILRSRKTQFLFSSFHFHFERLSAVWKTLARGKENSNRSNSYSFPTRSDIDLLFLSSGWYARSHFLGTGTNGPPPDLKNGHGFRGSIGALKVGFS